MNEMETFLAKVASNFLETKASKEGKEYVLSKTLVMLVSDLSSINKIALSNWRKPLTEAKKEEIGLKLASILYHCGVLIFLLERSPESFNNEALTQYADEFAENYLQDSILCSMNGITTVGELVEELFNVPLDPDATEPLGLDESFDFDGSVAELLATSFILASRFDLDIEVIMYNALLIDKF